MAPVLFLTAVITYFTDRMTQSLFIKSKSEQLITDKRKDMKLGIAGSGKIVNEFLSNKGDLKGLTLSAVWGRTPEKLTELAEKFGIERTYTDYDRMLASDIDSVYVALPNHLHYAYAKRALEAGKDVVLEKPFTMTEKTARILFDIAEENGACLFEAVTNQYTPDFRKIRELLPRLGTVRMVQGNYSQYSSRYDSFREGTMLPAFDPAAGGGALGDINIYNIHMTVGLFGAPEKTTYYPNMQNGSDTSGVLLLEYPGFTAVLTGAKDSDSDPFFMIQGEDGWIRQNTSPGTCGNFNIHLRNGWHQHYDLSGTTFRMIPEWEAFIDGAGRNRALHLHMKSHTLDVMRVLDEARASAGILPAEETDPFVS